MPHLRELSKLIKLAMLIRCDTFTIVPIAMNRNILTITAFLFGATGLQAQEFELDLTWPQPNGTVYAVSLSPSAETLYVGGQFTEIGGLPRQNLAAIDVASRTVTSWAPQVNELVYTLVAAGDSVLISGSFTTVNGVTQPYLAAVQATSGATSAWAPVMGNNPLPIFAMTPTAEHLYVAGRFRSVNGQVRSGVARFNAPMGDLDGWSPQMVHSIDTLVLDVDVVGEAVHLSGIFDSVNGVARRGYAEVDGTSGTTTALLPDLAIPPFEAVFQTDILDGTAYLYGFFTEILGQPRNHFAELQLPTWDLLPFAPAIYTQEFAKGFSLLPDGLLVCGQSSVVNGQPRSCISFYDRPSGLPDGTVPMLLGQTERLQPIADGWVLTGSFQLPNNMGTFGIVGLTRCPSSTYHADQDEDGLGDPEVTLVSCTPVPGFVLNNDDCNDSDPLIGSAVPWYADSDGDTWGDAISMIMACTQPLGHVQNDGDCDDSDPSIFPDAPCDDDNPFTHFDQIRPDCTCAGQGVLVSPVVYLDVPLNDEGLMDATLLANGLLPTTEPYTAMGYQNFTNGVGGFTTTPQMLDPDPLVPELQAVDWVVVELRPLNAPTQIAAAQPCILRRNGNVHRPDALASPEFLVAHSSYFISVRHRNHLGIITSSALLLNQSSPVLLDFSDGSTPVNGGSNALKPNGIKLALWPGDVRFNRNVQYAGQNNDRDPILVRIGGVVPTNTAQGYFNEDINLDGVVKYTGTNNDRDKVLQTIGGVVPTNIRLDHLPN